eukprot:TRINITY_DN23562_c0_g1_i2.p1 TRINITY_DN23562_c0_g1~~TRINITY_DN23562_c0_g1_i2.p1  ORF type:complete len:172 (+),score=25.75 TRINITY_DN23562_c0_g1_i2:30-518(+)
MECPAAASTVDRELSARQGAGQTQAEEMQVTRELGFDLTNVAQAALLATLAPSSEHSYAVSGSGAPSGTFASLEPLSLPLASAPTCGERAGVEQTMSFERSFGWFVPVGPAISDRSPCAGHHCLSWRTVAKPHVARTPRVTGHSGSTACDDQEHQKHRPALS